MLFVYYNPNYNTFYTKYLRNYFNPKYKVGYVNQFDHIIVSCYMITEKGLVNCLSHNDYYINHSTIKKKKSLRNKLINRIICLLYKIKDEEE